jgi:hypothetical protein
VPKDLCELFSNGYALALVGFSIRVFSPMLGDVGILIFSRTLFCP